MKVYNWNDFTGGWFVGNFNPSILKSEDVEVCIKRYNAGDTEPSHMHKIADEITMVVQGLISMNGVRYPKNSIIHIEKGESTDFSALTDNTITCVVKLPSVKGDKYFV